MFKIEVDSSGPHAAVDAMIKKLNHFRRVDIGQEMSDWQVEDMNRNRPFTMRSRAKGRAATIVRPHSLYEVKQRSRPVKKYERAIRKLLRGKKVRKLPELPHRTSTRPYLRQILYDQLQTRMRRLMQEKLQWRR